MAGKVYLVGAGPGDPGLVTVKGLELIQKADCIVYDRLSAPELLSYAKEDCEFIYVGKADRNHTLLQEEINELLVTKAKEYACVVRLKGGDVYVFGRGGEEGAYLRDHGIKFGVVPGISSAIAGAAYAGIPVTHRGLATSFRVITAHNRLDQTTDMDFASMLDEKETLIFLMGLSKVGEIAEGLIQAGRSPMTPAAVISHATTSEQRTCVGILQDIERRVADAVLTSPAMIVIGDVVRLREQLQFFENQLLWGKRYLVPKIGRKPSRLAALLRAQGAFVQEVTVGEIAGIHALYGAAELADVDMFLFTSQNGVDCFMDNVFASKLDVRALGNAKIAAIGSKTAERLKNYGLRADFVPDQYHSDALVPQLKEYMQYTFGNDPFHSVSVWYPTAKNADDILMDDLVEICQCGRLNVYENKACTWNLQDGFSGYDGILFTCASSAERLFGDVSRQEIKELEKSTRLYAIGPKSREALEKAGASYVVEASKNTYEGLFHAVLEEGVL